MSYKIKEETASQIHARVRRENKLNLIGLYTWLGLVVGILFGVVISLFF